MERSRREFLKLSGLSVLGLALLPTAGVLTLGATTRAADPAARGKKLGMVVDARKCNGCQDCVKACHFAHNVPTIQNPEEEVKWIWTETYDATFPGQQHEYLPADLKDKPFMVMCNHCEHPACVRVCPTQATYQNQDGIIMMDYHRCIGCRYCMAACPFGARSFNFQDPRPHIPQVNPAYPTREKGVVEKCNFCAERVAAGGVPACVTACRSGALAFGDLNDPDSGVRKLLGSAHAIRRKPELGTEPKVYYLA